MFWENKLIISNVRFKNFINYGILLYFHLSFIAYIFISIDMQPRKSKFKSELMKNYFYLLTDKINSSVSIYTSSSVDERKSSHYFTT